MPIVEVPVEGLAGPSGHTPARVPDSARRTSHVDVDRDGAAWDAPTEITGAARDVVTGADGQGAVRDEVSLLVRADGPGGLVTEIRSDPPEPGLDQLVGTPVMVGFRRAVASALPEHVAARTLLYRLLDDVPLAFLVSGHSMMLGEPEPEEPPPGPRNAGLGPAPRRGPQLDVCAGWQGGGMLGQLIETSGTIPHSLGPPAPVLTVEADPLAWHARPTVGPRVTRRTRRLDLIRTGGHAAAVDAHFRDSYGHIDGSERSLHEYTLAVEVDLPSGLIRSAEATPRALPWPECPQAVGSAGRLRNLSLGELPERVRREFTGITTCTHLNDTMRSLADAAGLVRLLAAVPSVATPLPEDNR